MIRKSGGGLDPGRAKRNALFPEGRGLGVGGRKNNKKESKRERKAKEKVLILKQLFPVPDK